MSISRTLMVLGSILLSVFIVLGQPQPKLAFTLSPEQSNPGKFHVEFCCEGIKDEIQDFKMPAISPGYYGRDGVRKVILQEYHVRTESGDLFVFFIGPGRGPQHHENLT